MQVFLEQIDLIRRMVAAHPDHLLQARSADDVEERFCMLYPVFVILPDQ